MTASILLVVFLASLYFITRPLFSQDKLEYEYKSTDKLDRVTVFLTLNELEFDFKTGKLSLKDYESLSEKYKLLAADLLKKEGDMLLGQNNYEDIKDETEREIEAFISGSQEDHK